MYDKMRQMDGVMILAVIAQVVSAFAVAATAGFVGHQLLINIRTTRARIVADFLNIYFADGDMQAVFRSIDFGTFPHNPRVEMDMRRLNKLLGHFNGLARWWKTGDIKTDDLQIIDYQLCCIMTDRYVSGYVHSLAESARKNNRDFPFPFLMELWDERKKRKLPYHPNHSISRDQ